MEGVASEAASMAGHMKLGRLIYLYDDNSISIDGSTDLAFTEDRAKRFEAYGWHVQIVLDGNDIAGIEAAVNAAKADPRPSIICVRSVIGYGSPNKAGTSKAHGEPLGADEIKLTKQNLGWSSEEPFFVPEEALNNFRQCVTRGQQTEAEWEREVCSLRIGSSRQSSGMAQLGQRQTARRLASEHSCFSGWNRDGYARSFRQSAQRDCGQLADVDWRFG